jgi:hypothetical protein
MDGDPPGADAPADAPPDTADRPPEPAGRESDAGVGSDDGTARETGTDAAATGPTDAAGVDAYTTGQRTLSPRVQVEWILGAVVTAFVLAAIATVAAARFGLDPRLGPGVGATLTLLGLVHTLLRYRVWAYEVRADTLYLQRGVLTHTRTLVPYVRIQHVDTQRGPVERALGLSTLVVYTAGSRGADVSIPGLTPEEADDLQRRVKELAIEAEGGDAV